MLVRTANISPIIWVGVGAVTVVPGVLVIHEVPGFASRAVGMVAPEAELAVGVALFAGVVIEIPVIHALGTLKSLPTKA